MSQRALEGPVIDPGPSELDRLRETNRALTRELADAHDEIDELKNRVSVADAPITRLREKLQPFYQLLQALFGDIDELAPEQQVESGPMPAAQSHVWESWKSRVGTTAGKIITALQHHRDANTQQLAILTGLHRTTIPKAIYELNKAGLINKAGGRFSLKAL